MTDYNQEYFFLDSTEDNKYPSMMYSKYEPHTSMELLRDKVLDETPRILSFGYPRPNRPLLGDYHFLEEHAPVLSERMVQVLNSFNLKNVQFVPAIILDKKEERHEGYYIIRVHNQIQCMDKEKSSWEPSERKPGKAFCINKLVLDNEELEKIPLENRLVFAAWEKKLKVCYHYSVVEKLLELEPKGMTIYRLSKWDPSAPFKAEYIAKLLGEE